MKQLIFARHGESHANLLNVFANHEPSPPLTDRGREQATALAHRLAGRTTIGIYTSPLLRAVQTAHIVGDALGAPVVVSDALREFDVGCYEGSGEPAHWREYDEVLLAWLARGEGDRRVGGGENLHEIRARFRSLVDELTTGLTTREGTTVLVGHGGLYRCTLPAVLANVTPRWTLAHPLANTETVTTRPHRGRLVAVAWGDLAVDPSDVLDEPADP
ncbi:probable phosphoglycerate mutase [Actinopolymorpha cephalotaxi]|uniref:Phosphoglycerate mutase n=1 Tax=Actinopolymorpha cephalotaxi TaxID=504797 RepID=A0A1I2YLV7_9ACTN|nr:histidine phosphatase family protein [Actinopolymorpha cephalotaxi]NYH86892.1 putative phosphoglycerate mutase [Actinopolymorpha cephalotaxi]SFH26654.1 probable phosphoglycerate mutase [Actinopolymorpha cephalotaxi]